MLNQVDFKSDEFIALCEKHKVKELYAFGSVTTKNFNENSDIDLIVEFKETDPIDKGKLILSLYAKFEKLFNKKVDLLTYESIRNPFLEEHIGASRQLIYPV
jgi:predicted nucleotidyltransferase